MSLFPHQTRVSYFSFHRLVRSSVSTLQFQLYTSVFPLSNFSHQLPLSSSSFTPQSFRSPTFLISFHSPAVLYSLYSFRFPISFISFPLSSSTPFSILGIVSSDFPIAQLWLSNPQHTLVQSIYYDSYANEPS